MKKLILICILFSNNIFSQEIDYNIFFKEESVKIGDSITLISTLKYPKNIEIIQPDSSYKFIPFEFLDKIVFESSSSNNIIFDSTIYILQTFELDSIQSIYLKSYIINTSDSLEILSNTDKIRTISLVNEKNSKTKTNTLLEKINSIFNSKKFSIITGVIFSVLVLIYLLFRKKINKYFKIKRIKSETDFFKNEFDTILSSYLNTNDIKFLENLLLKWKRFMEKLSKKPYSSSTSSEISLFNKNIKSIKTLKEIDKCIYSENEFIIDKNKLIILRDESINLSKNYINQLKNEQ
ncbi:MAG: hypothetical protein ACJZ00_06100 [Cytophagales bacterium]|nr:MAG: hypothetical protein CND58_04150 [Rhodothermaeota bacterium MED-G16]